MYPILDTKEKVDRANKIEKDAGNDFRWRLGDNYNHNRHYVIHGTKQILSKSDDLTTDKISENINA